MPKEMFWNIPEEKRTRFLDTAMTEFTTKSFEQVSVNSIIKKANISRGSFYTYFENLESLFKYIFMESVKKERVLHAKKILKNIDGDVFEFIRQLFKYDYDAFSEKGRYSLFRNYVHYIQTVKKGSIKEYIIEFILSEISESYDIHSIFDLKSMNITFEKFLDLLEIIVLIMLNTFLKAENENLNKEQAIELFNNRLNFLEFGLRKEDKKC